MGALAESKPGRREQNKIQNRRAILDAGLEVFGSIGYERATITDVVKASGLSVGTFYNYYGDKDSVFAELVSELLAKARIALNHARNEASSLEDFIMGAFEAYGRLIAAHPAMQNLIAKNTQSFRQFVFGGGDIAELVTDLESDMDKAIKLGVLPAFPVRLMTSAMIGAGAEVFAFDSTQSDVSPEVKARFLGDLFIGGIQRLSQARAQ